jgi:hypothetical protein
VDFVENYNFQVQNEVLNMHWNSYQINPNFDGYDENFKVLTNIIFMSQMFCKHDFEFV